MIFGIFDVDFVDDRFDVFVDGLQNALPSGISLQCQTGTLRSPYNSNWHVTVSLQFKLARYGLLTIQTGALRSPYNQTGLRHFYEWVLPFCLRRPQAPPEPDLVYHGSEFLSRVTKNMHITFNYKNTTETTLNPLIVHGHVQIKKSSEHWVEQKTPDKFIQCPRIP